MRVLLLLFGVVFCQGFLPEENGVFVLDNSNIDNALEVFDTLLVKFYSPSCSHCKALAPEYDRAAQMLKEASSNIRLAKVDVSVEADLAKRYDIRGYPTVKLFHNNEFFDYNGERNAEAIMRWCQRMQGPLVLQLTSSYDVEELRKNHTVTVIGFVKEDDTATSKLLTKIAKALGNVGFGVVSTADVLKDYQIAKTPSIYIFKRDEEKPIEFTEGLENLENFVHIESVPLLADFNEESATVMFNSPLKTHFLIFLSKKKDYATYREILEKLAIDYKHKIHMVIVDVDVEQNQNVLIFFSIEENDIPCCRMVSLVKEPKKFMQKSRDLSYDALSRFINDVLSGVHSPFFLSQEIPESDSGPVKVLVGKNYESIVQDTSKSVCVMIYAPWCGHCKQIMPIWEQLAESYKDVADVIIAKMDATENEVKDLEIMGFPTIYLYPKGSSKKIEFTGERVFEQFKGFIESGGKQQQVPKHEEGEVRDEL